MQAREVVGTKVVDVEFQYFDNSAHMGPSAKNTQALDALILERPGGKRLRLYFVAQEMDCDMYVEGNVREIAS